MMQTKFSKYTLFTIMIFAILVLPYARAAPQPFGVTVIVCTASWYCSDWSEDTCGSRTCIDSNSCGYNTNKPSEYLECPEESSSGGGGGGSSSSIPYIPYIIKSGYFTLDTEIIKLSVPQETVIQKILKINSSAPGEYTLEISYPSTYTRGTEFVTTSISNKYIEDFGDFNIIVDTRNILVGTYSIPITITNGNYTKTINAVIDVTPKENIEMEITLDSKVKNLGIDNEIIVYTTIKGLTLEGNENIEYTILDPKGNVLYSEERALNNSDRIESKITMPQTVDEGYYVMSIKVLQGTDEYIKSTTFTVLPLDKYVLMLEEPTQAIIKSQLAIGLITIILAVIILINVGLFYKRKEQKYAYNRNASTGSRLRPLININLGIGKLFSGIKKKKEVSTKRLEVLTNTYERGFISTLEYRNALRDAGYIEESNKVWEKYNAMKRAEKTEKIENMPAKETAKLEPVKEKIEVKAETGGGILGKVGEMFKKEEPKKEIKVESIKPIKEEHPAHKPAEEQTQSGEKIISGALSHMFTQSIIDKRAPEHHAFVLHGNERLYCIRDLLNVLPNMPEIVLDHHTMHGRNDFADWIGDVFRYYDMAEELRSTKSKEEMIRILKKYE
ncbi:MAG: hypothetical protein ACP5NW_02900 [Candidatus Woesearchaeota archaeon]